MKKHRSALVAETLRSIWHTRTRFMSIFIIVALGCGFFAGLKASCPDMLLTADQYFTDTHLMDLHLMSTFGFNEEDLEAVKGVDGIEGFQPGYSVDAFLHSEESTDTIVKVYSLPENTDENNVDYLNRPLVLEGRLPEKSGECVVEQNFDTVGEIKLGDTVRLVSGSEEDDLSDSLHKTEFTIVGIVRSPLYLGFNRGYSNLGDGEVDAFLMIREEDFAYEVYTDVYLTLTETQGLSAFEDAYADTVERKTDDFEQVAAERGEARYQEIYEEAQGEIDDAKAELADGEKERDEKLAEAQQEIDDAEAELAKGRADYEQALAEFNQQTRDAENDLVEGEKQLADGENQYEEGLAAYEQGRQEYEENLPAAQAQIEEYKKQLEELQTQAGPAIEQLDSAKALYSGVQAVVDGYAGQDAVSLDSLPEETRQTVSQADSLLAVLPEGTLPQGTSLTGLLQQYLAASQSEKEQIAGEITAVTGAVSAALDAQDEALSEARSGIEQLTAGIAQGEQELADAKQRLDETEAQLAETRRTLDETDQTLSDGWRELSRQKQEGQQQLDEALAELTEGEQELADGKAELAEETESSAKELEDARAEIAKAERDLADLKEPTWYVWDRNNNPDYSSYEEDAQKVDAVSTVFPVFFILVAALVCLTSMTRMVEEQRGQIGTMKALGYGRGAIMTKYLAYAMTASLLGSVIGLAIGFKLFPLVIINAYKMMYQLPDPMTPVHWGLGIGCAAVAVVSMGLTTFFACYKQTAEMPAQLMRPKTPKAGKRVLLERIPFIWKRLSFSHKVTVRNLFRYKRRAMMTIIGVAGCTALMLTGFGLRYAIVSIGDKQYTNVFVYDTMVTLDDGVSSQEAEEIRESVQGMDGVEAVLPLYSRSMDAQTSEGIQSVSLMVPKEPENLRSFIDLHERESGEKLELSDNGVILNEKLGKLLDAGVGDTIILVNPDGRPIEATVEGIAENYALNYVYMTPAFYENAFRAQPSYTTLLVEHADDVDESGLTEQILNLSDSILGVTNTSSVAGTFANMLGSLNSIVWVIIISAGLLAMVVLYNLANINMNERIRELATIKVLGFFDREVTSYITREISISSLIGMGAGLVLGVLLEKFVVATAEVDIVMFAPDIRWDCFVFAALLTLLFTLAINLLLHFQLRKIDMVESLKSIE